MAKVPARYWSEIHEQLGRLPVWLPQTVIELGDVGILTRERWTKLTTLRDLGIPFQPSPRSVEGDIKHTSADVARADGKLAAEPTSAVPGLDLGAEVAFQFANEGGCVFEADDVWLERIDDLAEVQQAVLHRYQNPDANPRWERSWTFVTEIASGCNCRIMVAQTAGAEVTLSLSAQANQVGGGALSGSVSRRHGTVDIYETNARHTVLWSGQYVKDFLFARPRVDDRGDRVTYLGPDDNKFAPAGPPTVLDVFSPDDNEPAPSPSP